MSRKQPQKFVKIGDQTKIGKRIYKCVQADKVRAEYACVGCDLKTCDSYQCSKFDRIDGKFVWFKLQ